MKTFSVEANYVLKFINRTNRSIFLTGKAGTGKTTLLKEIVTHTHKNTVVVAPTGIAALNAGGVTIHSFFQLPFSAFLPDTKQAPLYTDSVKFENKTSLRRHMIMNRVKKNLFRNLELLVVDEVSMLRADVLDAMNFMLQSVRKNQMPFGGVQVLFIGDLLQLPPVVKQQEWHILKNYYSGMYFFHSEVIRQQPPLYIELEKIYRQRDDRFISILNNLRNNTINQTDFEYLNTFVQTDFDSKKNQGYITLTTHNAKADSINEEALQALQTEKYTYHPEIVGDFPEKIFPLDPKLELKVGAQVIFVKNDLSYEKLFFNGKMGIVDSLSKGEIRVRFPEENKIIEVEKYEWQNIRYTIDDHTKEIKEKVLGTFTQYPLKLAWAITIHKSQGLTFERAALDVSNVFLPGQAYVALSRLRSLKGLILLSTMRLNGLENDMEVMKYAEQKASEEQIARELDAQTKQFLKNSLIRTFSWFELSTNLHRHAKSYISESERSKKSNFRAWALKQSASFGELLVFSEKFVKQLHRLFHDAHYDLAHIKERVDKAYAYFFPKLDQIAFEILYTHAQVKQLKKSKAFAEELKELEEEIITAVLGLKKVKLLLQNLIEGKEINKSSLYSPSIAEYKINHLVTISQRLREAKLSFDKEDSIEDFEIEKPQKKPKKSSAYITFELWQEGKRVEEIAEIRKLTSQTIYSHISKLVKEKKLTLDEVIPVEKIEKLVKVFENEGEATLTAIKAKVGDAFSWEELRIYKSSL